MFFFILFPRLLCGQWLASIGDLGGDEIVDVQASASRLFAAGYFQQSLGPDSSKGGTDVFIKAYSLAGVADWQYVIGAADNDLVTAIATVSNQFLYAAGTYSGQLQFGQNDTSLYSQNKAIFVSKFDQGGQLIWAKSLESSALVVLEDFVVQAPGRLFLCGAFQDSFMTSGPNVLLGGPKNNPFVVCLDDEGLFQWSFSSVYSSAAAQATSLAFDSLGQVYVAGEFNEFISWQQDTFQAHPIFPDIFLLKLNAQGDLIWNKQFEGAYNNEVTCLAYHDNNLYMGGQFKGNLFLDTVTLSTAFRDYDAYLACLDNSGFVKWATQSLSPTDCILRDIAFFQDQLLLVGYFQDTFYWQGQALVSVDQTDAFLLAIKAVNNQYLVQQWGGTGYELLNAIRVLDDGTIVVGGGFQQTISALDTSLNAFGFSDAFLASQVPFVLTVNNLANSNPLEISIYPNPFTNVLYLDCSDCAELEWLLYDVLGNCIQKGNQQQINTQGLFTGQYFLKVKAGKKQKIVSIIRR